MEAIDKIITSSLRSFLDYVNRNSWVGRENEAISLFAFGFLRRSAASVAH